MADDTRSPSPKIDPVDLEPNENENEDAETRAARRELKQSSISDPTPEAAPNNGLSPAAGGDDDKAAAVVARPATPADDVADAQSDDLKEQISSPKKKRPHDQLDGGKDADETDARSVASTDSARDRASRLEPEKKRHRDEDSNDQKPQHNTSDPSSTAGRSPADGIPPAKKDQQTSAASFGASSFGKLAAGASPFAALGGASKPSVFGGGGAATLSSFASPSPPAQSQPAAPPKLTFGTTTGASPFAGLSSGANGFGSAFGKSSSTFGSALSGAKPLQGFGAPSGGAIQNDKPAKAAKPFGAPDSDAEEDEEDNDEEGAEESTADDEERGASPEKESEERRRMKLQKVEVDDGETGETTLTSVRAKIFHHDRVAGWKERGAGMLKINVPQACAEFDESGAPIPGSFDASGLEADEDDGEDGGRKVCRLIMRQDQTHRVILNTAIVPAMKFQEKASLKSVGILFTAFEGEQAKPVSITMRMSAANAKTFMNEMSIIQRELQSN